MLLCSFETVHFLFALLLQATSGGPDFVGILSPPALKTDHFVLKNHPPFFSFGPK
jgi:hypothetical protein